MYWHLHGSCPFPVVRAWAVLIGRWTYWICMAVESIRNCHYCTCVLMLVCLQRKLSCMWLMCFKNYRFNLHVVQLALHKKDRNKGSKKCFSTKTSRDIGMMPNQVAAWKTGRKSIRTRKGMTWPSNNPGQHSSASTHVMYFTIPTSGNILAKSAWYTPTERCEWG